MSHIRLQNIGTLIIVASASRFSVERSERSDRNRIIQETSRDEVVGKRVNNRAQGIFHRGWPGA